jgi:hypothetical protein
MGEGLRKEEALFVFSINVSHLLTRLREWLTYWLIRIPFPVLCFESFFGMHCCKLHEYINKPSRIRWLLPLGAQMFYVCPGHCQ